jgi:hypothetical protein
MVGVLPYGLVKEIFPTSKQTLGFYLVSAYEYGVGTPLDLSAAMKWYNPSAWAVLVRPLNRQVARLSALENAVDIHCCLPKLIDHVDPR